MAVAVGGAADSTYFGCFGYILVNVAKGLVALLAQEEGVIGNDRRLASRRGLCLLGTLRCGCCPRLVAIWMKST